MRTWILSILLTCSFSAWADEVVLPKPLAVELQIKESRTPVRGQLTRYDDDRLTIRDARKQEQVVAWADLVPASAYNLKARLIDKNKAEDWLELGRFGWKNGVKDLARQALATAVKKDPSLKEQADEILASSGGAAKSKDGDKDKADDDSDSDSDNDGDGEMLKPFEASASPSSEDSKPPATIEKYQKSTPEQDEQAIARAREAKDDIEKVLDVKLAELQTPHFLIFTDWDKREHKFLEKNLEAAYAAVSKQFDIPVKENVFVGKLPVYMLNDHETFLTFAHEIDNFAANKYIAGYYSGRSDGSGHMVMWKPDVENNGGDVKRAELLWAYVLTHEFTHAFVARYRTNRRIPMWINEGTADVIASRQFPRPDALKHARDFARGGTKINHILEAESKPLGQWYPVMRTLVETLVARDRKAFLAMFNDLKDGMDAEEALEKHYKWDHADLTAAWRTYLKGT